MKTNDPVFEDVTETTGAPVFKDVTETTAPVRKDASKANNVKDAEELDISGFVDVEDSYFEENRGTASSDDTKGKPMGGWALKRKAHLRSITLAYVLAAVCVLALTALAVLPVVASTGGSSSERAMAAIISALGVILALLPPMDKNGSVLAGDGAELLPKPEAARPIAHSLLSELLKILIVFVFSKRKDRELR